MGLEMEGQRHGVLFHFREVQAMVLCCDDRWEIFTNCVFLLPVHVYLSGVFVSKQKGDTDMGSKVPKDILVKGE